MHFCTFYRTLVCMCSAGVPVSLVSHDVMRGNELLRSLFSVHTVPSSSLDRVPQYTVEDAFSEPGPLGHRKIFFVSKNIYNFQSFQVTEIIPFTSKWAGKSKKS